MKRFEIFRPGKHTAASGVTLNFSDADLQAAVAAYDPAVHEAPIVVGHPKDNAPAYGWIGSLSFGDAGAMEAAPIQVDADFAEMVSAGRFKKRSASWYVPGSANHPLAGKALRFTLKVTDVRAASEEEIAHRHVHGEHGHHH